ncbi:hypothetical protein DL764_010940 [Monosporascus ibericus]|uniref:Terpene synthase n=1 Tax=Monosporascus ibericus TaxID=155417 RepID=A0A4Q4ST43_9PEZI|nr:hypothetical protein DL764_010940 [Monosporascus ibericus]
MAPAMCDLVSVNGLGIHRPSPRWIAELHPRESKVSDEVNGYFLEHWPFPNEKARKKFVASGFPRATCFTFPRALDDRIHFVCRLLTLLFLVDDLLEDMSLEDGRAYNERLMAMSRGDVSPDRNIPVEYMMWDLWESMRAQDRESADELLEPTFEFMRAQTHPTRLKRMELKEYLEYRVVDVGTPALMRFSMALHLSPEDLALVNPVERNFGKQLSVMNDIYSFEKELLASKNGHEGGFLCSAVSTLSDAAEISYESSRRILYALCREWELTHERLVQEVLAVKDNEAIRAYLKAFELQMSGNEEWSTMTQRYRVSKG